MTSPDPQHIAYTMRLQRFLARAGVASRRGSENLMTAGRVCVNGQVVRELGSKVDPDRDVVTVDGIVCHLADDHAYLILYKPAGYLTTMSDPQGRPTVADLVPTDRYPGLYPVGRLDADTTGILLFTTNGEAGQNLLHPASHVWKHYVALVRGVPTKGELQALRTGVDLDDGRSAPAEVQVLDKDDPSCRALVRDGVPAGCALVGLTIHEGKKHQVKRMLSAVGHEVIRLHRDSFGPLELTDVALGHWRLLTEAERAGIEKAAQEGARAREAWRARRDAGQRQPDRRSSQGGHKGSRKGSRTGAPVKGRR